MFHTESSCGLTWLIFSLLGLDNTNLAEEEESPSLSRQKAKEHVEQLERLKEKVGTFPLSVMLLPSMITFHLLICVQQKFQSENFVDAEKHDLDKCSC